MEKSQQLGPEQRRHVMEVALGHQPADYVIHNVSFLDVFSGCWRQGDVAVAGETIAGVLDRYTGKQAVDGTGLYLVPGFIDAHVHIESSMLTPSRFQEVVLPLGTTTAVWDPHEIANVRGLAGIDWALAASRGLLLDILVMIPSCVPATSPELGFETSGAVLSASDLRRYRGQPGVLGLAEMMNYPGLLGGDGDVLEKLEDFKGLKRDGHSPGLVGHALNAYAAAGINSCHESTVLAEAQEKLTKGIHVLIREGSCAKDANELLPILNEYSSVVCGLCSDDRNPLDIQLEGHLNHIVAKGLARGLKPEVVFRAASFGAAQVFGLHDRGAIAPGLLADFILIEKKSGQGPVQDDWRSGFQIRRVWKKGNQVNVSELRSVGEAAESATGRNLHLSPVRAEDFRIVPPGAGADIGAAVKVIGVRHRQILTDLLSEELTVAGGQVLADLERDILKIAVLERHRGSGDRGAGFVKGFGLKTGAIATSINHDSHNVIVVGSSDALMAKAVNELIAIDGGIVVVTQDAVRTLRLPIGGLMTMDRPENVAGALQGLKALAAEAGCRLEEPFLQLSFLALPVIPKLKITDQGLVDVTAFRKTALWADAPAGG